MASSEILTSYIKKLGHPLQEIRERALQLIIAKLQLGWELEDELSGTRDLLDSLFAWFHVQEPTLQKEALYLLLTTLRTQAGAYIMKEKGVSEIVSQLKCLKNKIDPEARGIFEDIVETLQFMNSVESQESVAVPELHLPSITSSDCDASSNSGYFHGTSNEPSSRRTSVCNDDVNTNSLSDEMVPEGISILLLPWAHLCPSDTKTLLLIENALRVLKSTRRSCRFIRDVFLRDFPAEMFLNRPSIIQSLVNIVNGNNGSKIGEALYVLLCITKALCSRIRQLTSLDLINETQQVIDNQALEDQVNIELQDFTSEVGIQAPGLQPDSLEVLKQLPAPIFALDTMHVVLSVMARSLALCADNKEVLDMHELNLCLCLIEELIKFLLQCVGDVFWCVDHKTKTHRDIAHKSCMLMRLLGDLLNKYRASFNENVTRKHHHMAWLRLTVCATDLAHWSRESALPPKALVLPLQAAQLDQAFGLFYPKLAKAIDGVLQGKRIAVDKEYKSKYKELTKLFISMEEWVKFIKNEKNCRTNKDILPCIKKALPILELHLNEKFLEDVGVVLFKEIIHWDMSANDWTLAKNICVTLLAHRSNVVRAKMYAILLEMVRSSLVGDDAQEDGEKCLNYLCDVGILTEICCHGICDKNSEVSLLSSELTALVLRGRMLLSERCWWRLLSSLMAIMPLLHVYAAPDTILGQAIIKSLEVDIAECMGIPRPEVLLGLVRLLFLKHPAVRMDAAHSLCHLLDDDKYLPPKESLRADIIINALQRAEPQDFNVNDKLVASTTSQTTGLVQILDVLKQDLVYPDESETPRGGVGRAGGGDEPALDPALRRDTLQQLAVLVQQTGTHDTFLQYDGIYIVVAILRMSLLVDDYLAFPECAHSCVSVLNSVCYTNRQALAKYLELPAHLLRVILIFPTNESTVSMCAQILSVCAWSGFIVQQMDRERKREIALPNSVLERVDLPFKVQAYWTSSQNAAHSPVEWLLCSEEWVSAVRVRWAVSWRGGGGAEGLARGGGTLQGGGAPPGPLALRPAPRDVAAAAAACVPHCMARLLLQLQNATDHNCFAHHVAALQCYTHLIPKSDTKPSDLVSLPWVATMRRFLWAPPASPRDVTLLTNLLNYILVYMDCVPNEGNAMDWIKECVLDSDASVISLLSRSQLFPQQSASDDVEVTQLHIHIVRVLRRCVDIFQLEGEGAKLESLLKILLACLDKVDLKNFHMLGYLNELMRCIRCVVHACAAGGGAGDGGAGGECLVECLRLVARTLGGCAAGAGSKGRRCRLDALLAALAVLRLLHRHDVPAQRWYEYWAGGAARALAAGAGAGHAGLRAAALLVAAALAQHSQLLPTLTRAVERDSLSEFALEIICNKLEANIVRTAAAALLTTLTAKTSAQNDIYETDILKQLSRHDFGNVCLHLFVDFCGKREFTYTFEPNIPLSILERRSQLEVSSQKREVRVTPADHHSRSHPPPSPGLVLALVDVIHNVVAFAKCPVLAWNELGLFRILFKCLSWSSGDVAEVNAVRMAACRTLARVADSHRKVRHTLANTRDCLHHLLAALAPVEQNDFTPECYGVYEQMLTLVGTLLPDGAAADSAWQELEDRFSTQFFHMLLQCLETDDNELIEAAMFCLSQLATSITNKKTSPEQQIDKDRIDIFDETKSPYYLGTPRPKIGLGNDLAIMGTELVVVEEHNDCMPEYAIEEICKVLMGHYHSFGLEKKGFQSESDDIWSRVCSCLSSIFSVSGRARNYAVHRQFPKTLLVSLQGVRDNLSLVGKTADVIRNANNNPILRSLNWLLIVMTSVMTNCPAAKESLAENGLATSLNRLWPWCMMVDSLRLNVVQLLLVFTNDCPKAWSAMCSCVSGRTLGGELGALAARQAALLERAAGAGAGAGAGGHDAAEGLLCRALRALTHCMPSHHCRALVLKSGVLSCINKLIISCRRNRAREATAAWCRLAEAAARFADGAASLLELRAALAATPLRAPVMTAVAHIAHHHRSAFLQHNELVELLGGALVAGAGGEAAAAARAVWALAANNHKAKLQLRSAGLPAALQTALDRLQRSRGEPHHDRLLELLTYTATVLAST